MYQSEINKISEDAKISDLVLNYPYALLMLEHFGIELPLQEKLIKDICTEYEINIELFLAFTNLYSGVPYSFTDLFSYKEIHSIINYLKNSHQYYSKEIYPKITNIIGQLNYTSEQMEMQLVEKFFNEYFNEVLEHLNYENEIVFPYILGLHHIISQVDPPFNPKIYSVDEYKEHHNDIEEKLDDLMSLLVKYLPGTIDKQIRRDLMFALYQLDHDLKIHSQIEDYILIPLVAQMEKHLEK